MTTTTFSRTYRNFQRAIARGDINASLNWLRVMQEQIVLARALGDLDDAALTPTRRQKPKAAPAPAQAPTPAMPVMLDPDGFSPGGQPNWFLNQQRLERAGLPLHLAPSTKARRQ